MLFIFYILATSSFEMKLCLSEFKSLVVEDSGVWDLIVSVNVGIERSVRILWF